MVEPEILHLRDEVRKRGDQQILLEQIINNLTSLLEGSSEAMCVFDKDGFLLHSNASSRRMLGISSDHLHSLPPPLFSRPNIFDFYTPWSKERVIKEFINSHHSVKPPSSSSNKWTGVVEMRNKTGNYEFTALQSIEAIYPSHSHDQHHAPDQVFYKTYFSIHLESSSSSSSSNSTTLSTSLKEQERISTYTDLVKHLPMVGVGIWRYEGEARGCAIRLVCANALASHYAVGPSGPPLLPGSVIHEVLPNGIEVHRFLQEVIHTKRLATIDQFHPGPGLSSFAVTAIPLSASYVAVVMEPPRCPSSSSSCSSSVTSPSVHNSSEGASVKSELDTILSSSLAMATCAGQDMVMCNAGFSAMLGLSSSALIGRNIVNILEMRTRHAAPSKSNISNSLEALRNALLHVASSSSSSSRHPSPHVVNPTSSALPPPCQIEIELEKHAWLICVHPLSTQQQQSHNHTHQPQSLILVHRLREIIQIPSPHSVFHIFPPSNSSNSSTNPSTPLSSSSTTSNFLRDMNNKEEIKPVLLEQPTSSTSSSLVHHPRAKRPHPDHNSNGYGDGDEFIQHQRHRPFVSSSCSSSSTTTNGPILPPLVPSHDIIESQILKHSSAATACIDSRGNFVMANKAFAQILGFSSDSNILNTSFLDLVYSEDEDQARNVWRQLSKHELQTFDVALRFVLAGGPKPSPFTVASFIALPPPSSIHNSPSSLSSSSPSWMNGSVVVLQLHHAGRLRHFPEVFMADKEMLRSVFREVIVGTAVVDPLSLSSSSSPSSSSSSVPHRLHMANPSFCAILGAPESELTGRALLDMIHPDNRDKVAKVLKEVSAGHTMHHQLSIRTLPKSGPPRWAAMSASAVLDSHATPFLLLAQLQLVDKPFQ